MRLTLIRTPDILAELGAARKGAARPVLVGFAAESGDPVARGRAKLTRKAVDLIVANDVSLPDSGFDSDHNTATIIDVAGSETFPTGPKTALASRILDRAERLLTPVVR
jgi:phosphopantothenoylcysteine decarboxylase/phosphopantothenate--cysteine ligase